MIIVSLNFQACSRGILTNDFGKLCNYAKKFTKALNSSEGSPFNFRSKKEYVDALKAYNDINVSDEDRKNYLFFINLNIYLFHLK